MVYEKLHIIIALTGTLAAAVISFLSGDGIQAYAVKVAGYALAFYILGRIVKAFLDNKVFKEKEDDVTEGADGGAKLSDKPLTDDDD